MARVPYREPANSESPPDLVALYDRIANLRGSVHNLHRALANQPAALEAFMGMSRYVRDESSLRPALRELAILATAFALDVPYEKFHHVPAARRAGVGDSQLSAFPSWSTSDAFDPTERAVLAYADQTARERRVNDETYAELARHLSTSEIVDLTVTLGWYHLCAAIVGALEIDPEGELPKASPSHE